MNYVSKVAEALVKASAFVDEVQTKYNERVEQTNQLLDTLNDTLDTVARELGAYDLGDLGGNRTEGTFKWSDVTDKVRKPKSVDDLLSSIFDEAFPKAPKDTEPTVDSMLAYLVEHDGPHWNLKYMQDYYRSERGYDDLVRFYTESRKEKSE
jgi:hypothetical protein